MFFETYFIYLMEAPRGLWNDTWLCIARDCEWNKCPVKGTDHPILSYCTLWRYYNAYYSPSCRYKPTWHSFFSWTQKEMWDRGTVSITVHLHCRQKRCNASEWWLKLDQQIKPMWAHLSHHSEKPCKAFMKPEPDISTIIYLPKCNTSSARTSALVYHRRHTWQMPCFIVCHV